MGSCPYKVHLLFIVFEVEVGSVITVTPKDVEHFGLSFWRQFIFTSIVAIEVSVASELSFYPPSDGSVIFVPDCFEKRAEAPRYAYDTQLEEESACSVSLQ